MNEDAEKERIDFMLQSLIGRALDEDRVDRDVTTLSSVPESSRSRATVLFRSAGILAGTIPCEGSFHAIDRSLIVRWMKRDGESVGAKESVATIEGSTRSILRGERTALNFLMQLSGVATLTGRFVEAVRGKSVEILDTRKTTPGFRVLEKRAVVAGGGVNHRSDLAEMALLKENHIAAAGGIDRAVRGIRERFPGVPIEVEVETIDQLRQVLALEVNRVMLDNFSDEDTRRAVALVRSTEIRKPYVEASGGMTLERVSVVASLGVDGISIGSLTHSAPACDVSLLLEGP